MSEIWSEQIKNAKAVLLTTSSFVLYFFLRKFNENYLVRICLNKIKLCKNNAYSVVHADLGKCAPQNVFKMWSNRWLNKNFFDYKNLIFSSNHEVLWFLKFPISSCWAEKHRSSSSSFFFYSSSFFLPKDRNVAVWLTTWTEKMRPLEDCWATRWSKRTMPRFSFFC